MRAGHAHERRSVLAIGEMAAAPTTIVSRGTWTVGGSAGPVERSVHTGRFGRRVVRLARAAPVVEAGGARVG